MIRRDDMQDTPDFVPASHCCQRRTCAYCEPLQPELPPGVVLGEN